MPNQEPAFAWPFGNGLFRFSTQALFCPCLKTFIAPFLPAWLTAPGSLRMVATQLDIQYVLSVPVVRSSVLIITERHLDFCSFSKVLQSYWIFACLFCFSRQTCLWTFFPYCLLSFKEITHAKNVHFTSGILCNFFHASETKELVFCVVGRDSSICAHNENDFVKQVRGKWEDHVKLSQKFQWKPFLKLPNTTYI